MARNPCEDEIIPPDPEEEPEEDEEEDEEEEEQDNTDEDLELPPAALPPFPAPFDPRPNPEIIDPPIAPPPVPLFATAMREVTTIPNSLFMTEQVDVPRIAQILKTNLPERDRGTRAPLHGALWFGDRPEDLLTADLFRWSLYSVWNSDRNSEYFFRKSCGRHENIWHNRQQLNVGAAFYTDEQFLNFDDARILELYYGASDRLALPRSYTSPNFEELEQGEFLIRENIRFSLRKRGTSLNNININSTAGRIFHNAFLPAVIRNSDMSLKQKISMFLNIYLFGNSNADSWRAFGRLNPPSSTADYYRQGVLSLNRKFDDYVFDAPVAFFEEETNNMLMSPFHSAKVEKTVGNVDFVNIKGYSNELEVPNIYHYYNSMQIEKKYKNRFEAGERGSFVGPLLTSQEIIRRYKSPERDNNIYATPSVLKFPSDKVEKLEEINEFMRGYAENYVEISIKTSQKGTINSFLQRNKMDRLLLEIIDPVEAPNVPAWLGQLGGYPLSDNLMREDDINTKLQEPSTLVLDDSFTELGNEQNSIARTENDRTVSGVPSTIRDSFFKILKEDLPASNNRGFQRVNQAQYPLFYTGWENVDLLRLEEHIKSQIFVSQTESFIRQNKLQRSYADILNGQKAYSEVVGYKIEKHVVNENEGEELIQTFLLMDSNDIEQINFIDSQIMPFKKYKYKIFTINLVVGNRYEYDSQGTVIDAPLIDLEVKSQKRIYIIDAPFFEQVIETKDMPPMFPQVNFLPYQGVEDRFAILLQQNYGELKETRVLMPEGEQDYEMHFKTDSMPSAYQWFRIEEEPEEYSDFSEADSGIIEATGKTAFLFQEVTPNKYYYYTFRAIDNYDFDNPDPSKIMYSNPTEVFRVRMVSYENGIFMEMEPLEMYKKVQSADVKFERLLKISPSFEQTLINFSNSFSRIADNAAPLPRNSLTTLRKELDLIKDKEYVADTRAFQKTAPPVEELSLGIKEREQDKIWGKKFKFRLKSKRTGKMVDLNVQFSQERKTKPE